MKFRNGINAKQFYEEKASAHKNTLFQQHCGLGIDSASNRIDYQESFCGLKRGRRVGLTTHRHL
jgi:hypothetical protein